MWPRDRSRADTSVATGGIAEAMPPKKLLLRHAEKCLISKNSNLRVWPDPFIQIYATMAWCWTHNQEVVDSTPITPGNCCSHI